MPKPIKGKINVTRINKEALFKGAKGTYLDLVIWPKKDGPDNYGNTHTIHQALSKEARDRGEKEPIIGDLKMEDSSPPPRQQQRPAQRPAQTPRPPADPDLDAPGGDSIPF